MQTIEIQADYRLVKVTHEEARALWGDDALLPLTPEQPKPLTLTRPLCFFDIEGTGLDTAKDRIISIAIGKIFPDGSLLKLTREFNPGIPIPPETTEVNGYTDEIVKDFPPFHESAHEIHRFIEGCDLAGYNHRNYDTPLLYEEFARCAIDWNLDGILFLDVGAIFKKKEPRDLKSALKFYCNKQLADAHQAMPDVVATIDVLAGQRQRYQDLSGMSFPELCEYSKMDDRIDLAGKICRDKDGDPCFMIGNPRGRKVKDDLGFARWMEGKDFPSQTMKVLRQIVKDILETQGSLF